MPQLDFSFYLSQITWLVVAFGLFFCISKFFILPKLDVILNTRANVIDINVDFANNTTKKANEILEKCDILLRKTKDDIDKKIAQVIKEEKELQQAKIEKESKELNKKIQNSIVLTKEEFKKMENEINDFIVKSIESIVNKMYNVDFDANDIKKVSKKFEI